MKPLTFVLLFLFSVGLSRAQDADKLENHYAVTVTIEKRTISTQPSDKNPAPESREIKRITGKVIGQAVIGRIEKIASQKDYWGDLAQNGNVPVFTASSQFISRDKSDYSKITLDLRNPLNVTINRTEMDYVPSRNSEKYVKNSDFKAQGKNEAESISLRILPYHSVGPVVPISPHYVIVINVNKYTDKMRERPVGNGNCLKWDYEAEQLTPVNAPLYLAVTGTVSEANPTNGDPVLTPASELNNYFLKPSGRDLVLSLSGSTYEEENQKRSTKIHVKLEFSPISNTLQLVELPSSPPAEDWE